MMKRAIFTLLLLVLMAGTGSAAQTTADGQLGNGPVQISAERLEADDAEGRMKFLGNVVASQDEMFIYAGELVVRYSGESREVERIDATGDVRVVQGARVATGQKAVFYRTEGRIVLTGNPRVHQGEDFIEGDEITVFVNQERSIVSGQEGSRVNAIFHPKEKSE